MVGKTFVIQKIIRQIDTVMRMQGEAKDYRGDLQSDLVDIFTI